METRTGYYSTLDTEVLSPQKLITTTTQTNKSDTRFMSVISVLRDLEKSPLDLTVSVFK